MNDIAHAPAVVLLTGRLQGVMLQTTQRLSDTVFVHGFPYVVLPLFSQLVPIELCEAYINSVHMSVNYCILN